MLLITVGVGNDIMHGQIDGYWLLPQVHIVKVHGSIFDFGGVGVRV